MTKPDSEAVQYDINVHVFICSIIFALPESLENKKSKGKESTSTSFLLLWLHLLIKPEYLNSIGIDVCLSNDLP